MATSGRFILDGRRWRLASTNAADALSTTIIYLFNKYSHSQRLFQHAQASIDFIYSVLKFNNSLNCLLKELKLATLLMYSQ